MEATALEIRDVTHPESDVPAQITIALVEFVQTALAVAARSYWRVLPNPLPLRRTDVVMTLAALPKPLRVAPLAQPGALGTWPYEANTDLERQLFDELARKVQNRVAEILSAHVADGESVPVLLEHEASEWLVPSTAVQRWSKDYVMDGVGWILVDSGGDPRAPVRFVLSRPDGTWFPALPRHPFAGSAMSLLEVAESEAARYQRDTAGTEHVLLAVTKAVDPVIHRTMSGLALDFERVDDAVARAGRTGPAGMKPRPGARSSRLRHALEAAARIAKAENAAEVDGAHLLRALLLDSGRGTILAEVLQLCGRSTQEVAAKLEDVRAGR